MKIPLSLIQLVLIILWYTPLFANVPAWVVFLPIIGIAGIFSVLMLILVVFVALIAICESL